MCYPVKLKKLHDVSSQSRTIRQSEENIEDVYQIIIEY